MTMLKNNELMKSIKIKSTHIKNFTVFKDIKINFSSGINIFIGENGSGKTNLLKAIYAFTKTSVDAVTDDGEIIKNSDDYDDVLSGMFNLHREWSHDFDKGQASSEIAFETEMRYYHFNFGGLCGGMGHGFPHKTKIMNTESLYIPAKDMLTHSGIENEYAKKILPFDNTHIDILLNLREFPLRDHEVSVKNMKNKIKEIIGGSVLYENGTYFILRNNRKVNFFMESEGYKKLAVIYRALDIGYLKPGSVLILDEPEVNLNIKVIPFWVEIFLELSRNGVQIFLSTHDYVLSKYFEVRKKDDDRVIFHSLVKTEDSVNVESNSEFRNIENNVIIQSFDKLLDEVITGNKGD